MFSYYFTYQPDIPTGIGFGQFSLTHMVMLGLMALMGYGITMGYKASDEHGRLVIRRTIAVVLWTLELFKDTYLALTGQFEPGLLPLHLCGMGLFILAFDAIKPMAWTRNILYSFTVWAATAALLFPDWAYYPIMNQWALQSFVIHALLVTYPVMLMVTGEMVPKWRELPYSVAFLCFAIPVALTANHFLGTNFFFLSVAAPGSPLEPLQNAFGSFYIPVVLLLLMVLWVVMYLPWEIHARRANAHVMEHSHL